MIRLIIEMFSSDIAEWKEKRCRRYHRLTNPPTQKLVMGVCLYANQYYQFMCTTLVLITQLLKMCRLID